jgi:N-acetylmuramoyl-L-alanine amidase
MPPPDPLPRRLFLRQALSLGAFALTFCLPVTLSAAAGEKRGRKKLTIPQEQSVKTPSKLLMIDPGHGGKDPGAIGRSGTYEKDITLDIARRLAQNLAGQKSLNARLTRDRDEFIPLADRVKLAREQQADFFISIHADSAGNPEPRGFSAYTLSETASDEFAHTLAHQENQADRFGGMKLDTKDEDVANILFDLATRQNTNAAQRAKISLVKGVGRDWRLLNNPIRSANFAVLRAPDVPSILIETGFLSNPEDEKILRQPQRRELMARLLAREISTILNESG